MLKVAAYAMDPSCRSSSSSSEEIEPRPIQPRVISESLVICFG